MNREYYDSIDRMEKHNVSRDFVLGWAAGYLGNPQLEEQRRTEAIWLASRPERQKAPRDGSLRECPHSYNRGAASRMQRQVR